MARDPSITQDQVSRAAAAIQEEGSRPTARAIRERLGGVGSMATVLKYFQAWQDTQVRPAETPVALPAALQRGLLDFVAAEVGRSKVELQAELEIAGQANADLILEVERQGLTVENLTLTLEAAYAEKAGLAGRIAQLESDLEASRHEATAERQAAETARTEHAKAALRLEAMPRLEADLIAAREAAEQEQVGRIAAEQAAAVAGAKLDAAMESRARLEAAATEARAQFATALAESKEREVFARDETASVRADLKQALARAEAQRSGKKGASRLRGKIALSAPSEKKKE